MKRITTYLLLMLSVFALSGCSTNENNATEETGNISSSEAVPEGDYVSFSIDSGFYEDAQEIVLTCNVEGASIYYTLDHSTPDKTSTLYKSPIKVTSKTNSKNVLSAQEGTSASNNYIPDYSVDKGTVIRAIAYLPDGTTTPLTSATYFVGLDQDKYADVPIISLVTDFENLYDYETGIYVLGKTYDDWIAEDPSRESLDGWMKLGNYSNSGREWERPVSVEFITADGTVGFKQNMGIRIMGGASRNQAQKSLKLIAREEYGQKNVKYALIPDNLNSDGDIITKYKSFVLRVGGNDADYARLRDPYLQALVSDAHFITQQTTPCVVFLNGEYWGMYTITEDYTDNHIENNYGLDNNNVIIIKCGEVEEGEEEDLTLFQNMYHFITQNDMSNPELYAVACDIIDADSFADYFAFQLYIANADCIFQNNNWRMWRARVADTTCDYSDAKWRFAAYDNDFSTGIYSGSSSATLDNISSIITPSSLQERLYNIKHYVPIELFRSLIANEEFKSKLILALCDMRNIYFEANHAQAVLEEMSAPYLQLMPDTLSRFGPDWIAYQDTESYYSSKVTELSDYLARRYLAMPNLLQKVFGLSSSSNLSISMDDVSMGTVLLNGRELDLSSDFSGIYYAQTTVTVTAIPAEGYRFSGWETKSSQITDTTSATLEFRVGSSVSLKPIFEKE